MPDDDELDIVECASCSIGVNPDDLATTLSGDVLCSGCRIWCERCENYNYEDGVYDFFSDIKEITIERFLDELYGIQWGDGNNEEFFDFHDALSDMLFKTEFEYVKSYYDAWIQKYCPSKRI